MLCSGKSPLSPCQKTVETHCLDWPFTERQLQLLESRSNWPQRTSWMLGKCNSFKTETNCAEDEMGTFTRLEVFSAPFHGTTFYRVGTHAAEQRSDWLLSSVSTWWNQGFQNSLWFLIHWSIKGTTIHFCRLQALETFTSNPSLILARPSRIFMSRWSQIHHWENRHLKCAIHTSEAISSNCLDNCKTQVSSEMLLKAPIEPTFTVKSLQLNRQCE